MPSATCTSLLAYSLRSDRIRDAWRNTPTKWYPLPVGVGAVLLAVIHYRRQHTGAAGVFSTTGETGIVYTGAGDAVRISGPWQVGSGFVARESLTNPFLGTCSRRSPFAFLVAIMGNPEYS
jgi:hypothetical protein